MKKATKVYVDLWVPLSLLQQIKPISNIYIFFNLMFYGYHRAKQEQMGHQVQMVQLDYR